MKCVALFGSLTSLRSMEELELRMLLWSVRDYDDTSSSDGEDAVEDTCDAGSGDNNQLYHASRGRRRAYSNAVKLQKVDDVKAGGKVAAVADAHGIDTRTAVYAWIRNEASLREVSSYSL
ncbi:hypothetical protein DVH05_024434 [Phytophthora capsici]|nr:hypothetical protein DVH05_024434 [Phytophthora capsici]